MIRLPWHLSRGLVRLSRERTVGLGVLAICLVSYMSALQPTQARRDRLQADVTSLHERVRNPAHAMRTGRAIPAEQLAVFYRFFPSQTSAPDWLDKIYKAARNQNIQLDEGDYRAAREKVGKLVRYQITLPVKANYLQLRKFLAAVLAEVPIASLDHISFERQKIGDEIIEAEIKLTLYLDQET
jgi:Tfp pilus assembly protein PilO